MKMLRILLPFTALAMGATAASAAVITLDSVAAEGSNFRYTYSATLNSDEGVKQGSQFYIFDFAGLVAGSVTSTSTSFSDASELTSTALVTPGETDDISIANLVFTYNGADFRTSGGPFATLNFVGFSALSTLGTTANDAFSTISVKNNPVETAGTALFQQGQVQVPSFPADVGTIPEPATWAMMIGGFGFVGAASRRRRNATVAA